MPINRGPRPAPGAAVKARLQRQHLAHRDREALRQAEAATPKGRIPLAVIRDDRADAFVSLSLDDFLELVREWWEGRTR